MLLLYRILLGDLHGDACVDDYDGDGISDQEDVCPTDPKISRFDFTAYTTLILDAEGSEQDKPFWKVNKKVGRSISCFKILSKLKPPKRCTLRVSLEKATRRQMRTQKSPVLYVSPCHRSGQFLNLSAWSLISSRCLPSLNLLNSRRSINHIGVKTFLVYYFGNQSQGQW